MKQIEVQKLSKEDIPEVVSLGLSTQELHMQDETPIYYTKEDLERFIQSSNDIALVAKVDGNFAGYRLATFNPYLREAYLIDTVVKCKYALKCVVL